MSRATPSSGCATSGHPPTRSARSSCCTTRPPGKSPSTTRADLLALAVAQGINGLSAKQAAGAMFGAVDPAPAQVERARRKLNKLVADGLLQMVEGTAEKAGGTPPRAWFPTDRWDG